MIGTYSFSQNKFVLKEGQKQEKIKFQLINNLIIFPVEVNGVELSFLLDTGVSKPIIFNFLNITDTLQIKNTKKILLHGLGEGKSVEAYKSHKNFFRIGDAFNVNQDLFIVIDPSLNFTPRLGIPVHGIIGYNLFKDFIVEINYSKKFLKLIDRRYYNQNKYKRYNTLSLNFFNNKPYLDAFVVINKRDIPLKLLIDTGGSDALWLFEDEAEGIYTPDIYFDDYLGKGLSGSIYGKRSKTDEFNLSNYNFTTVNVAYPNASSIKGTSNYKARNGSISAEILKRFNFVFDYRDSTLFIKKNKNFKAPFYYNKSGLILEHNGLRIVKESQSGYNNNPLGSGESTFSNTTIFLETKHKYLLSPAFKIVELRENSPAHKAGLMLGDVILEINKKGAHKYILQDIMRIFCGEENDVIRLKIDRRGKPMDFKFKLESLLKKPQ